MAKNKISAKRFRFLLNLYPPFLFNRIRIESISEDYKEVVIRVKKSLLNRNLAGTIFGGTIFSAADPFYPLMYWQIFAHRYNEHVQVWLKSASIKYLKPSDTNLYLHFKLEEEDILKAYESMQERGKHNAHHKVEIRNKEDEVCAVVELVAYVGTREN